MMPVGCDVGAVVLAAGASTRLGCPKQLLPWDGDLLVVRAVRTVLAARVGPVTVVLGHCAEAVAGALAPLVANQGGRLLLVVNHDYREAGQSSSVRLGVKTLAEKVAALVFVAVDQPLLRSSHVDMLMDAYLDLRGRRGERVAVVPCWQGRRGHPVLFGRGFFPDLMELRGDEGGRVLLNRYPERVVEVPDGEQVVLDVDTWEDYAALIRRKSRID